MPSSIASAAKASIVPIERMELAYQPAPWPFAERHRAEIDAWFADRQRKNPALWNGRVLMLARHEIAGSVFRGSFIPVDYASFRAWHDRGHPETGVRDSFAAGVLRAADGAFLLGVMSTATANAGRIYFPCGTPDLNDVIGATVDLDGSVRREVAEETGLTPSDYDADPGWITVLQGPHIAHMKVLRLCEQASTLRDRILGVLARQLEPELSDIRIVRGPADLDPMMPPFVVALLHHLWAQSDRA
jgi:8-oxo-dGTP pyrophosphatase MutT (NUDIX family)